MKNFLAVALCGVILSSLPSSLRAQEVGSCLVDQIVNDNGKSHLYLVHSFAQVMNGQPAATGKVNWASGARVSLKCGDQAVDNVALSCNAEWNPDVSRAAGAELCAKQIERDFKLFFYAQQSKLPISVALETLDAAPLNQCLADSGCPTKLIQIYRVSAPQ